MLRFFDSERWRTKEQKNRDSGEQERNFTWNLVSGALFIHFRCIYVLPPPEYNKDFVNVCKCDRLSVETDFSHCFDHILRCPIYMDVCVRFLLYVDWYEVIGENHCTNQGRTHRGNFENQTSEKNETYQRDVSLCDGCLIYDIIYCGYIMNFGLCSWWRVWEFYFVVKPGVFPGKFIMLRGKFV